MLAGAKSGTKRDATRSSAFLLVPALVLSIPFDGITCSRRIGGSHPTDHVLLQAQE